MKREQKGTRWPVLMLAAILVTGSALGLVSCAREQTEEQSRALVALEAVVSWYEKEGQAEHWEDLMALCFANYADGVAVNWSSIELPEAEVDPLRAESYIGAIITDVIKGEGNSALYTNQLLLRQDPETGAFGHEIMIHNEPAADVDELAATGAEVSANAEVMAGTEVSPDDEEPAPADEAAPVDAPVEAPSEPVIILATRDDLLVHISAMLALNIALGPESYDYEEAAAYLLRFQTTDGGFAATAETLASNDVILTGLASCALTPYYQGQGRNSGQDKLAEFYRNVQDESGGYCDHTGALTAEATAAAIYGLTALELELPATAESGQTPLDFLLELQNPDGTFRLQLTDEKSGDAIATRRAATALCDILNSMNTYQLLATDSETYRLENPAGPTILLTIQYPPESGIAEYDGSFTIERNSSVFDATIFYGLSTQIPVSFSGSVSARAIEGINNVKAGDYGENSGWVYYVNDQISPFPPSAVLLEEGDSLRWEYQVAAE